MVVSLVGRVFPRPLGRVFGMHMYSFWYESRSNGVFFSLLSLGGLFPSVGYMTPLPPSVRLWFDLMLSVWEAFWYCGFSCDSLAGNKGFRASVACQKETPEVW